MRGQKSWKKSNFHNTDFLYIFMNVDNRQRKWSIKRKYGFTEQLRELNPCINIKVPSSATYLQISSTVRVLSAWRGMASQSELRAQ